MDDKVKHRIVGVIVIAAFLVIIVPALIKNVSVRDGQPENQRLVSVSSGVSQREPETFQTSQIAQVSLDHPTETGEMPAIQPMATSLPAPVAATSSNTLPETSTPVPAPVVAPAPAQPQPTPAQSQPAVKQMSKPAAPAPAVTSVKKAAPKTVTVVAKPVVKPVVKPIVAPMTRPINFCIQLGTFSSVQNAQALVKRLHANGFYAAKSSTITLPNGQKMERVTICRAMTRSQAMMMRAHLARMMNTNVIVIKQEG